MDSPAMIYMPPLSDMLNAQEAPTDVGTGTVVVTKLAPASKVEGNSPLTAAAVHQLDDKLAACSNVVRKLTHSVTPWGFTKNRKASKAAASELEAQRSAFKALLLEATSYVNQVTTEFQVNQASLEQACGQLEDRDKLAKRCQQLEAELQAKDEANEKLRTKLSEIKATQEEQAETIRTLLAKVESVVGGSTHKIKDDMDTKFKQLTSKVEQLLSEHANIQTFNVQLTKAKGDLLKKVKELQDKVRDENDVSHRETRRLQSELKKLTEQREAEVSAAKEQSCEQVQNKTKELKNLQRRFDVLRSELEQSKNSQNGLKAALDEANAALAKSGEDSKALSRKLQDAKLQKEDMARELEQVKAEQLMLHNEFLTLAQDSGLEVTQAQQAGRWFNRNLPWPRVAFVARNGKLLHNRTACCGTETHKITPITYNSHKELEAFIQDEALVLCHSCRTEPGF